MGAATAAIKGARMRCEYLGDLAGPLLIFGGPYSNLQATRALRSEAETRGVPAENCICTGDVVAYCADPADTVAELRDWGAHVIAGNCEKQLATGADDCGCGFEDGSACDLLSASWYSHADAEIGDAARGWMGALPDLLAFRYQGKTCLVCHGGFSDVSRFLWPSSSDEDFMSEFQALESLTSDGKTTLVTPDIVLSGHSGLPFERRVADTRWINAGAIGMPPHDGAPQTRFVLFDGDEAQVHRLDYDWRAARTAMETKGLTQGYQAALESGWWPSEDVLPAALRR